MPLLHVCYAAYTFVDPYAEEEKNNIVLYLIHVVCLESQGHYLIYRAANRYEKFVFVTKIRREYENTKMPSKSPNS